MRAKFLNPGHFATIASCFIMVGEVIDVLNTAFAILGSYFEFKGCAIIIAVLAITSNDQVTSIV